MTNLRKKTLKLNQKTKTKKELKKLELTKKIKMKI